MIASRRGLTALSVIAAVLLVIVALDPGRRGAGAEDRRLVPDLAVDRVQTIASQGLELARDDAGWRVVAPAPGPADAAAVRDLLGAIAAARWERRVPDAPAFADARAITLGTTGGARITIHLGAEVAGADQVWGRVDDGPPLLVPSWVATAAARDLASVRRAQLVRVRPGELTGVELHGRGVDLVTSGVPMVVHTDGGAARVRRELAQRLEAALLALRASSFPSAPGAATSGGVTLRVLGGAAVDELAERGPCPGRARETELDGTAGPVCVADAQLAAVLDAARAITAGPDAIDPAPIARAPVARIAWGPLVVDAAGGGFTVHTGAAADASAPAPADDDAVHAAIDALTAPAAAVEALPAGATSTPAVEVRHADGTTESLEVVTTAHGPALRRAGEPFVLRVAPAALAATRVTLDDLRDRALVTEEPSGLVSLDVTAGARHRHAARGATLDDWTGDLDAAAVLAAAGTIAQLRAARFTSDAQVGAPRATITATFAAPPVAGGQPQTHTIELGIGCAARVDHVAVILDDARCRALRALLAE